MSLEYREQRRLVILDKALIGLLILLAGFLFNRSIERFKSDLSNQRDDRQSAIAYHERRLREFLYPLYYLVRQDDLVFKLMYKNGPHPPIKTAFGQVVETQTILPNHEKISQLISDKSFLLGSAPKLQATIDQYVYHFAVLKALRASESSSDPYSYDQRAGYPLSFSADVLVEINVSEKRLMDLSVIHP